MMFTLAVFASVALLALFAYAETRPPLLITGTSLIKEDAVILVTGPLPPLTRFESWKSGAIARILRLYKSKGYIYARVWIKAEADEAVHIDIDEGRMAGVVFLGASTYDGIVFRMAFALPGDVFYEPLGKRQCQTTTRYS